MPYLLILLITISISSVIPAVRIITFGKLIQLAISNSGLDYLIKEITLYVLLSLLESVTNPIISLLNNLFRISISRQAKLLFIEKYTASPYEKLLNKQWNELAERAQATLEGSHRVFTSFFDLFRTGATLISIIIALWNLTHLGAIIILLVFIVILFKNLFIGKNAVNLENELASERIWEKNYRDIITNFDYSIERTSFSFTPYIHKLWAQYFSAIKNRRLSFVLKEHKVTTIIQLIQLTLISSIYFIVILLTDREIGAIVATFQLLDEATGKSNLFVNEIRVFYQDFLISNNLKRYLDESEIKNINENQEYDDTHSDDIYEICLKDVYYKYPQSNKDILKGINLRLVKNEVVGIVGKNGSGKTTLCNVICGLLTPNKGDVLINSEISSGSTRLGKVHVTHVDFGRYPLSLQENITFSDKVLDDSIASVVKDLVEICGDKVLVKGFKNSIELSSGQWQRIAIARALNFKKPVIIFDEPTATMDPISEIEIVNKIIETAKLGVIVVIVAHRVSAVMNCDRVLVMEEGRIVQEGEPHKLLEEKGAFYDLYNNQVELLKTNVNQESTR